MLSCTAVNSGLEGSLLEGVVDAHLAAFPTNFTSMLGPAFLAKYYSGLAGREDAHIWVATSSNKVVGFACGVDDSRSFYQSLKRDPSIVPPVLMKFATRVDLRRRIFRRAVNVLRRSAVNPVVHEVGHEIMSVAVSPDAQGTGVGSELLTNYLSSLFEDRNVLQAFITTDSDDERVLTFYERHGFRQRQTFDQSDDRRMTVCAIPNPYLGDA